MRLFIKSTAKIARQLTLAWAKENKKKRTSEHVRAVKNCSNNSAFAVHVDKTAHTINFNNVQILDKLTILAVFLGDAKYLFP